MAGAVHRRDREGVGERVAGAERLDGGLAVGGRVGPHAAGRQAETAVAAGERGSGEAGFTSVGIADGEGTAVGQVRRGGILGDAAGVVTADGRAVVDAVDGDGDGVGRRAEVGAVGDLEADVGVGRAVLVGIGHEAELAGGDFGCRDHLVGGDGDPARAGVVLERAVGGERRDLHQRDGRAFGVAVGAEVGQREDGGRVFVDGDRIIRRGRGIVDGRNVDRQGVSRRTEVGAVGDLEADVGVGRAVLVGIGHEAELACGDVGGRDHLVRGDRDPAGAGVVLQHTVGGERGHLHRRDGRAFRIAVAAEVGQCEDGGRVLDDGNRIVRRGRRVVRGSYANGRCRRARGLAAAVGDREHEGPIPGRRCVRRVRVGYAANERVEPGLWHCRRAARRIRDRERAGRRDKCNMEGRAADNDVLRRIGIERECGAADDNGFRAAVDHAAGNDMEGGDVGLAPLVDVGIGIGQADRRAVLAERRSPIARGIRECRGRIQINNGHMIGAE